MDLRIPTTLDQRMGRGEGSRVLLLITIFMAVVVLLWGESSLE